MKSIFLVRSNSSWHTFPHYFISIINLIGILAHGFVQSETFRNINANKNWENMRPTSLFLGKRNMDLPNLQLPMKSIQY